MQDSSNNKNNNKLLLLLLLFCFVVIFYLLYKQYCSVFCSPKNSSAPTAVTVAEKKPVMRVPDIKIVNEDGYKLMVNGQRFIIRGACYHPVPVGKDYQFNFWGDASKPWLEDAKLLKDMGANTVRIYRAGKTASEVHEVLNTLYRDFGIHALMGTYLGFWDWPPPNYADETFREKVRSDVIDMVREYKDNPGILMWVLGNENNYSFDRTVQKWSTDEIDAMPNAEDQRKAKAKIYYSFVNDLAKEIKTIDPKHPVVMGVGEVASLDIAALYTPDVDVVGMIAYRGPTFSSLFRQVKQKYGKPIVMIEWGADSYNAFHSQPDEDIQAEFMKNQWIEIKRNADKGEKNSLGGTFFEWTDEWWKANENLRQTWSVHEASASWSNSAYYYDLEALEHMNMNEEWWGVMSLDAEKGENGLDARVPKKAYYTLKSLWTEVKS